MSQIKEFNTKFEEYQNKIKNGETPDIFSTTQLLLLAKEVLADSDDVAGEKGKVDLDTMIDQLGVDRGGLLGDIDVSKAKANREEFLEKYQGALDEELKAKKNAAEVVAATVIGLGTTVLKLAV